MQHKFDIAKDWLERKLLTADDTNVGAGGGPIPAVRAKMLCNRTELTQYGPGDSYTYKKTYLGAVYGDKGENAAFAKATPSGECWLQIDAGLPANEFFKPGKKYYLTFTEAPD